MMIRTLRKIKFGWYIILFSLIFIVAGLSMIVKSESGNTFLCLDPGCKWVQGLTLLGLALFMIVVGTINIRKK